jgi:hypothetical protein
MAIPAVRGRIVMSPPLVEVMVPVETMVFAVKIMAPPVVISEMVRLPAVADTVPISVPITPTFAVPVVLIVRFDTLPTATPLTVPMVIALAMPVPTVNMTPLAIVAFPRVIAPVDVPPTVAFAVTVTGVVPRLIAPVPNVEIVPAIDLLLGAVAANPPVNVLVPPA